jgi:pimeloyl-ACP methyl ester carboxylesterase
VAKFLFPIPESGLERRLWRIKAPTLIVWGEQDRFISPMYADVFREKIASAKVVKIPNAGHLVGLESPGPYADALLRWGQQ